MTDPLPRVLVVDDDADLLQYLVRLLGDHGFAAEGVDNGAEAVERLGGARFDVVLSDLHMPRVDGLDLLSSVRRRDLDVPVVLMTADPNLDSAMMAVEDGAARYLTKPISRTTLLPALERAVAQGALARSRRAALERERGTS